MAREEVMVARAYVDEHGDEVLHDEVITHVMKSRNARDASLVARGLPTAYPEEIEEEQLMQECWEFEQARLARETRQCSTQPRLVVEFNLVRIWFCQSSQRVFAAAEEEKLSTYNNMARGLKKHLKRFNAPHHWMLDKLGGAFAPKPSSSPHKTGSVCL
ncbi:hypothetical protein IFM89_012925 [Coptis chinensis]|uniref:Small ribosomal subunit protein eS4 N-terminal domain-containing protein n=1 Tax=Coptis chinensis TaxID=261450 RepID=A0A835LRC8_9MAGN|nr:hypothetical protein IFM89_012925 [Coptis chinensis]